APTVTNGAVSFTSTSKEGRLYQPVPLVQNNKYYVVGRIKADSNQVVIRNYSADIEIARHSGSGNYEKISGIFTSPSVTGNRNIAVIDKRESGWTEVQVDYVM